jgi:hypothetical protein
VKREHADFLVVTVGGHPAAVAKEDEVVGVVPVLDDVESFVDFASQLKRSKIAAPEDGFRSCQYAYLYRRLNKQQTTFCINPFLKRIKFPSGHL